MAKKPRSELEALKQVPLFMGLSKNALKWILNETTEELYSPGQDIVKEGAKGGRFFVILSGRAKIKTGNRTRRKIGPGDFFGEISLIDKAPRSATVQAETHIRALAIASWNFLALLQESWPMTQRVMGELCRRIREIDSSTID